MQKIELPKFSQWKKILKVLHKREKIVFLSFLALAASSLLFLGISLYISNTKVVPASGGKLIEGVVGQPRFLNPIYGETNDVDRDLIELIYSGLMTYDNNGNLVNDLVDSYKISEDGRNYEFTLKDKILWQDGKPLTSEDVVFTIKTIQNSDYKSPLRANWLEVDTEIISEKSFRLKLKSPYNSFLENCTLKIIPKHIWESIVPENFALSFYNLQPIGSGPYKFKALKQTDTGFIKSLDLKANPYYYFGIAHISDITFSFFENKENLIKAASKKLIDSYSSSYLDSNQKFAKSYSVHYFSTPRYFATFLNQDSELFSSDKIREAINYATNKDELVKSLNSQFSKGYGIDTFQVVQSPILPDFFNYQAPEQIYPLDIEKAKELLDSAGFKENAEGLREKDINKTPAFQFKSNLTTGSRGTEVEELQKCLLKDPEIYQGDVTGYFGKATKEALIKFQNKYLPDLASQYLGATGKTTRAKLNELCTPPAKETLPLKVIITTVNQSLLIKTADILKSQWEKAGFSVEIRALGIQDLKPIIKNRDYDVLLYGEALGMIPDLYPFWHSSQKLDPGLNLSVYGNDSVDKLLKQAREALDNEQMRQNYEDLQDILLKDTPAVFLYNSGYVYLIDNKIKGIETSKVADPSERFTNIKDWYIKTKRAWK